MCWFVHSAIVPSSNVRPIDTSVQSLGVKRTSGLVRACGELARHRELLARPASNSDDSSDEHDRLDVATSRHKVNTWLVFQPCSLIERLMVNLRHRVHWLQPVMLLSPCSLSLKTILNYMDLSLTWESSAALLYWLQLFVYHPHFRCSLPPVILMHNLWHFQQFGSVVQYGYDIICSSWAALKGNCSWCILHTCLYTMFNE